MQYYCNTKNSCIAVVLHLCGLLKALYLVALYHISSVPHWSGMEFFILDNGNVNPSGVNHIPGQQQRSSYHILTGRAEK